jgi:hypothetical protein
MVTGKIARLLLSGQLDVERVPILCCLVNVCHPGWQQSLSASTPALHKNG